MIAKKATWMQRAKKEEEEASKEELKTKRRA